MLYAISHNKAGRNFNNEETDWRQIFRSSEDSLTSMVFERLFYLPYELFWNILRESCYGKDLPPFSGPILAKEFWPHWDGTNTNNTNLVEPDVFVRFNDFDLIIEAKRWDYNQQSRDQWSNEINAYRNEYEDSAKKLYFIALGGIYEEETEILLEVSILKSRWKRILAKVIDHYNQLSTLSSNISSVNSIKIILHDLILVFQLHGYSTGTWLSSLPIKNYEIGESLSVLCKNSLRFDSQLWISSLPSKYNINTSSIINQWKI